MWVISWSSLFNVPNPSDCCFASYHQTDCRSHSMPSGGVPVLSQVLLYTKQGWPTHTEQVMQLYRCHKDELTIKQNSLLWGIRVVVPSKLKESVLQELHQSHLGIARMKVIAWSYIWWPLIDQDIEDRVKCCDKCQSSPPVAPLHPWLWPSQPWQWIHIDYAGPVQGTMLLVVVDAHSKWPEVVPMSFTSSHVTIRALRRLFATYGLPCQVISDNGPQFTSSEFASFLSSNGVKHIKSSPWGVMSCQSLWNAGTKAKWGGEATSTELWC